MMTTTTAMMTISFHIRSSDSLDSTIFPVGGGVDVAICLKNSRKAESFVVDVDGEEIAREWLLSVIGNVGDQNDEEDDDIPSSNMDAAGLGGRASEDSILSRNF